MKSKVEYHACPVWVARMKVRVKYYAREKPFFLVQKAIASCTPSTPSGYEINEGDITGSGMLRKNITAPHRVAL